MSNNDETKIENGRAVNDYYSYANAHGTVMLLAWMLFASITILFARYGRLIYFGSYIVLDEKIWFQNHRLIACLTTILTLLGFFLILVAKQGTWVSRDAGLPFAHSVIGGIIVCLVLLQTWMALFRCHQYSSYRFIFNWIHRTTGILSFILSIPTLFLMAVYMDMNRISIIAILSIWSAWTVFIFIILEIIRFRIIRINSVNNKMMNRSRLNDLVLSTNSEQVLYESADAKFWNIAVLIIFVFHLLVSIAITIRLIDLLWNSPENA